jgi:hypothetical protein
MVTSSSGPTRWSANHRATASSTEVSTLCAPVSDGHGHGSG